MRDVVLLSGGVDSTTLLYYLGSKGNECFPMCILYGQRHKKEVESATKICQLLGIPLRVVDVTHLSEVLSSALTGHGNIPDGYYTDSVMSQTVVPNRNMIFLSIASGYALSVGASCVAYAAHTGDHAIYPDCRPEFIESVGSTIRLGTDGLVDLVEPFTHFTKAGIVRLGIELKVPYELTWSCYNGRDRACGRCGTCSERVEAFKLNYAVDPILYEIAIDWKNK